MKVFVSLLLLIGIYFYLTTPSLRGGLTAPYEDKPLKILQGVPYQKGFPAIIEFWATWCGPCQQSIPHLNELYRHFQSTGLQIIGVTNEPEPEIQAFLRKKQMNYTVAIEETGELSSHYGIRSIPQALLVNREGIVVWKGHPSKLTVSFIEEKLK